MADIAKTAANVRLLDAVQARGFAATAGVALTAGDLVCYHATDGTVILTDADAVATSNAVGMVSQTTAAGGACTVYYDAFFAGFTLTDQEAGNVLHVSTTAGAVADAAVSASGDTINAVGWVKAASDPSKTKYLHVFVTPQNNVAIT